MANETIAPALTAKEWQSVSSEARGRPNWRRLQPLCSDEDDLPAAMALVNHYLPDGHPLKITREDVEALHEAAGPDFGPRIDIGVLRNLAAKLAALLPPNA